MADTNTTTGSVDTDGTRAEHIAKLRDLVKDVHIAMLTTMDEHGIHRSRPMATQEIDVNGDIWFFTKKNDGKAGEVKNDSNVNVSYSDPKSQVYVSVSGTARLIDDEAKEKELWTPAYKAWFPDGLDDPSLTLMQIHIEQAEYWDSPSSPVAHLVGLLRATATGQGGPVGDNQKFDLEHDRIAAAPAN